jgi:hypothetical protein
MRLKTRIVLLDSLLLLGIAGQWWLVGWRIDRLRDRRKQARPWIFLAGTITISGIAMALTTLVRTGPLEFLTAILSLIALLAWLALVFIFAASAGQWALRLSRKVGTSN